MLSAAAHAASPLAWWRAGAWLHWQVRALQGREPPEAATPPHGVVRLPPYVRSRRFGPEVLEERVDASGEHVAVFGPPGSGKSWCVFAPTLLNAWLGSTVVNDPKSELWTATAGARALLGKVLLFAPVEPRSCRINLLNEVRIAREHLVGDAERLSHLLLDVDGTESGEDQFWRLAAARLVQAAVMHVRLGPVDAGLPEVARVIVRGDLGLMQMRADARHPLARDVAVEMLGASSGEPSAKAEAVRSGVRHQALNAVQVFLDERVRAATSGPSDLALGDLQCAARPTSLYLASSLSDRARLAPLTRATTGMVAAALTAHERTDNAGRPKRQRLLFALDEAPLAGWRGLADSVALGRSYGLTYMVGAQSRRQLRDRYGRGIVAVCGTAVDFRPTDLAEAQELSAIIGKNRFVERVVSENFQGHFLPLRHGTTYSTRRVETDAIPAEHILSWPARSWAIVSGHGAPWIGRYAPAFDDPRYADLLALQPPVVAPLELLDPEPEREAPAPRRRRQPGELPLAVVE